MTISNPTNLATLTGNGVTTSFPFTFLIPDSDSIEVTILTIATSAESDPLSSSLYSVTGLNDPAGGSVTYPLTGSPLSSAYKINIRRVMAYEQGLSLTAQSGYDPEALEDQLDFIVMMIQQIAEETSRAVTTSAGSGVDPTTLITTLLTAADDADADAATASVAAVAAAASAAAAALFDPALYMTLAAYPKIRSIEALGFGGALKVLRMNAANNAYELATVDTGYPPGHLSGLTLSNNGSDATNDIDIAAGTARDGSDAANMALAAVVTRQQDVAYGIGNGGRFDASDSDGWWNWFVCKNAAGSIAVGSSKSLNPTGAANYPSGYTYYRRIGSLLRSGGAWVAFTQNGDKFTRITSSTADVDTSSPTSANRTSYALTVPDGIAVTALFRATFFGGSGVAACNFTSLSEADQAPVAGALADLQNAVSGVGVAGNFSRITNTSRQIGARSTTTTATLRIYTYGWIDTRGRE